VQTFYFLFFISSCHLQTVLRIWDCLFYEGWKILLRAALTLVRQNRERLLATGSFTDAINIFKESVSGSSVLYCHAFLEVRLGRAVREVR
jgi:hypothetical protein